MPCLEKNTATLAITRLTAFPITPTDSLSQQLVKRVLYVIGAAPTVLVRFEAWGQEDMVTDLDNLMRLLLVFSVTLTTLTNLLDGRP